MLEQLPFPPEALLLALAVALYLSNGAQLLYANELLFVQRGSAGWRPCLPSRVEVLGRFLVLPHPLRPDFAMLRMQWPGGTGSSAAEGYPRARLHEQLAPLATMRWISVLLLLQLFVALPAAYVLGGNRVGMLLAALMIAYAEALALVGLMIVNRQRLSLNWSEAAVLGFESLVCLPYAINLYRRLTVKLVDTSWCVLNVAHTLLARDDLERFHAAIAEQVDQQLTWLAAGSASANRLRAFRSEIQQPVVAGA